MTLGMGKRQISKIILMETIFAGVISLAVGLVVGVFASQFMSILVAKMFEADMSEYSFVFSSETCIKTCIYFAIMYIVVILFNTFTISKYKLINLLNAEKKNEKVKIRNPFLCVLVFLVAGVMLSYAYWKVTVGASSLSTADKLLPPILIRNNQYSSNFLVFIGFYNTNSSKNEKHIFKRYKYVCIKAN